MAWTTFRANNCSVDFKIDLFFGVAYVAYYKRLHYVYMIYDHVIDGTALVRTSYLLHTFHLINIFRYIKKCEIIMP